MGLVQYSATVLILSANLVFGSVLREKHHVCKMGVQYCKMCPAGEYHSSCTQCNPCQPGTYTSDLNCEKRCHHCSSDCRPDFHLKVIQNCTSTSNVKCACMAGFRCTQKVPGTENCRYCVKMGTTTVAAAAITNKDKHTPSVSSSTSSEPCQHPKCAHPSDKPAKNAQKEERDSSQLAAILCPMVAIALVVLCICCPRDEAHFKQAIAKLCNKGGREASVKSKESVRTVRSSTKQAPLSLSAANLGPVNVHNPRTVIFSLLSQFSGQVDPTVEGKKTVERVNSEEEDGRSCCVCDHISSPCVNLSEEEGSRDAESIFFPSQEDGKDCHISKEEVL